MVLRTYTIKNPTTEIYEFFQNHPDRIDLDLRTGELVSSINHIDDNSEINFQTDLGKRLGIKIDGVITNTTSFSDEVKSDRFLYSTELLITKTNIGTSFVDIYNDYGGRNFFVDLLRFNKIRYFVNMNINGSTGTINFRIVDNGNVNNVLLDVVVTNGQNIDTITIPDPLFKNFRGRLRFQAKSTIAGDNPIFDRILIYGLMPNRL